MPSIALRVFTVFLGLEGLKSDSASGALIEKRGAGIVAMGGI